MDLNASLKNAKLRLLQMHFESQTGHIGGNLSCLTAIMVLHHLVLAPEDFFILSKGHGVGALYIALWSQSQISEKELGSFHQDDTLLAGHPIGAVLPGIRFSTGSLGHGFSLANGVALAKKLKRESGRVFCLTSDGEWQEGSSWEALQFAVHHSLKNLSVIVDSNGLQGFGSTQEVMNIPELTQRMRSFGVTVSEIDGHDTELISAALLEESSGLRIIVLKTVKGHGISFMENRMEWHYLPMTNEQYKAARIEVENS